MLETFTNAVNEFAFCLGYTAILTSVIYAVASIVKARLNKTEG